MSEERSEERGEAQAIEGYGCICGFKTAERRTTVQTLGLRCHRSNFC